MKSFMPAGGTWLVQGSHSFESAIWKVTALFYFFLQLLVRLHAVLYISSGG